ncbi:acyltransferase-like protein At1g54570, chloroplastic isoform X3 [Manihot esculenta]|nr:acyltransferase-like protein At1g54570, chloroplastic isoform X3 [Manihot esculenta]XP_043815614.1 acyltransferase-like protein At1g54570, chloroplastic isoform X3 [Manihot esculenta]KAG8648171.1 hypothetical protein MANES_09G158301v8 [Manihot esculenta]
MKDVSKDLEALWDDGYGTKTVKDYLDVAKEMIRPDGGPPRWFCPLECGQPRKNSPTLLFLPGMDGVGLGLILHHEALGKAFEVWCLHIPVYDRTPFEGLLKFVEETVRTKHAASPNRPIYLVGDSFGGCLALAVAARNPKIDLVLILANPATSFDRSQLQPLLPILEALPDGLHNTVPYLFSLFMGDPLKMATIGIENRLPPKSKIKKLFGNLTAFLPLLSGLADIIPTETLLWKLKLLNSAAAYANSCLHAIKAEVLVLASGKDYMLPSADEAKRLKSSLQNCKVRLFKDHGHTILLEVGISLLTIVKGTCKYRCSRRFDFVSDFVPPSMSEFKYAFDEVHGLFRAPPAGAMFSTLDDGRIVRGLVGVPKEGPVLFVGYHMLMGFELFPLVEEFLREKIVVRGLAHPVIFTDPLECLTSEFSVQDLQKVLGAVPVTASNIFRLLSTKSHVLLYPGGAREALHYKGEEHKLCWPKRQEFVRMAARFGAAIVPFGTVGEDDIAELVLDYNDLMQIPFVNDFLREINRNDMKLRDESEGEVANQELFIPGLLPKVPGRFYFLFGKPIETKGKEELLKDRDYANELYLQVKSEVEHIMDYLLKKREEDPYRSIIDRTLYHAIYHPWQDVPAFDP